MAIDIGKKYFFLILIVATIAVFLWNRWKSGTIILPNKIWLMALGALPVAAVLSSFTSGAVRHSLIGLGTENDTALAAIFWVLSAILAFGIWVNRREANLYVVLAVLGSGLVLALFQTIRILGGNFLFLSLFSDPATNLIGKWNEVGFFMGLVLVLSLVILEFLPWRRMPLPAFLAWAGIVLGAIIVLFINNWYLWLLLAVSSLILILIPRTNTNWLKRLIWRPVSILFLLSVIFLIIGQPGSFNQIFKTKFDLGTSISVLSNKLGVQTLEVSPSLMGTWEIAKGTFSQNPVLGVGPNKFNNAWLTYRPANVNETPFWSIDFRSGFGFWPTLVVNLGLAGFLIWLALAFLIGFFSYRICRHLKNLDEVNRGLAILVMVATVYLWLVATIYPPGTALLAYSFIFLGLFIALVVSLGLSSSWQLTKIKGEDGLPTSVTFGLVIGSLVGLILVVLVIQSLVSAVFYLRGINLAAKGDDINKAEVLVARAARINPNDVFSRSLVDLELMMFNNLLQAKDLKPEEAQQRFQTILSAAVGNAKNASNYNKTNYLNWLYEGQVYEAVVPLKVEGAYEAAKNSYTKALQVSGGSPVVLLNLARLEIAAEHLTQARNYLDQALAKKPNYTEAIFILAQLEANSGNLSNSIKLAEKATASSPDDPTTHFALGLLKYQTQNFAGARPAFEKAVTLNPNYANARYFLGLTYDALGFKEFALEQFKALLPNNNTPEIKQIITNLEAGRKALSNTEPPAPEDRKKLPVEDN